MVDCITLNCGSPILYRREQKPKKNTLEELKRNYSGAKTCSNTCEFLKINQCGRRVQMERKLLQLNILLKNGGMVSEVLSVSEK